MRRAEMAPRRTPEADVIGSRRLSGWTILIWLKKTKKQNKNDSACKKHNEIGSDRRHFASLHQMYSVGKLFRLQCIVAGAEPR